MTRAPTSWQISEIIGFFSWLQDHLLCLVSLRPSLALLNGTRVTEEDGHYAQLWAEARASAASPSRLPTGLKEYAKDALRSGEQRPSLTPSHINFEDVWSGGLPQSWLTVKFARLRDILSKQYPQL